MAQITLAWKIFWLLGIPVWIGSMLMALRIQLLDIDFSTAPEYFKTLMYILSCACGIVGVAKGVIACMHSLERLRTDRLKNDAYEKKIKVGTD